MAWLAVDKRMNNDYDIECVHSIEPIRISDSYGEYWGSNVNNAVSNEYSVVILPKGSIKKLIGRELKWKDEPVEIKEDEK